MNIFGFNNNGLYTIMCEPTREKEVKKCIKDFGDRIKSVERTRVHQLKFGIKARYYIIECEESTFNEVVAEIGAFRTY